MGKFWSRGGKAKEEIISDIDKINQITNSELFTKKTTFIIKFEISINIFNKLIGNCVVNSQIFSKTEGEEVERKVKDKTLNLSQFYKFFIAMMNCLPVFYKENVIERYNGTKSEEENDICPICEDKQVNIMLDCYHFFCEKCIRTWLFNKKNNCPLCRFNVNLKNYDGVNMNKHQWSLIDLDNNEYMKECLSIVQNALKELTE